MPIEQSDAQIIQDKIEDLERASADVAERSQLASLRTKLYFRALSLLHQAAADLYKEQGGDVAMLSGGGNKSDPGGDGDGG